MLTTPTLDKLHDLGLMGMARAFQEQLERADYQTLTFTSSSASACSSTARRRIVRTAGSSAT